MKTNQQFQSLSEMDMRQITGGDFAYDLGFFLREVGISVINGGFVSGGIAAATDLALKYRPLD